MTDATTQRLTHALVAASDHATARLVLDRLDLGGPLAAERLLGAVVQTVAGRAASADEAVTVSLGDARVVVPVASDGEAPQGGTPAWDDVATAIAAGTGRIVADRTGVDGVQERLAWDLDGAWAWPAVTDLDGVTAGPDLWRVVLAEQREEQTRSDRGLAVGRGTLRAILGLLPQGASSLRVVDTGPDRHLELVRDARGARVSAADVDLDAEAALIGGPVAFGSGAVTLVLHTGDEHAEGAQLRAWRVEPQGVVALDAHETRSEFGPRWFDRHHGLSYVDAEPIALP